METPKLGIVKVQAELFRAYREAKNRATAAEKEATAIMAQMAIPKGPDLAKQFKLKKITDTGEIVIQDGNGVPLGKISVFWYGGAEIPAAWRSRVS